MSRKQRLRGQAIAALALTLAGAAGCDRSEDKAAGVAEATGNSDRPNVLLISIDTLRYDHLGCYGYERDTSPNIDRIAEEGVLFENMISSTSWTLPAHACMFTGLADTVHGATDTDKMLDESRLTLAEHLKAAGYHTAGFFSGPTLFPAFGLGQGFDKYVDCTSYPKLSRESAKTPGIQVGGSLQRAAMKDITSPRIYKHVSEHITNDLEEPFFMFVHMWDPHFDFIPPPPFDTRFDPDYKGAVNGEDFIWKDSINARMPKRDLEHIVALYDGEIAWTDMHIGKILDDLDAKGLTDSTIVAIVADHGTEFFDHGKKGHRHTLYDELIHIPLVIRYPKHLPAGQRVEAQARMMDVAPTLVSLAGVEPMPAVMGQSLQAAISGSGGMVEQTAISELYTFGNAATTFRRLDGKLVRHEPTGRMAIYDLLKDPGEHAPLKDQTHPLIAKMIAEAQRATQWLEDYREAYAKQIESPQLPDEVRKRLESLGYIGRSPNGSEDGG
jgi:arylsulfatase A-like enzyme